MKQERAACAGEEKEKLNPLLSANVMMSNSVNKQSSSPRVRPGFHHSFSHGNMFQRREARKDAMSIKKQNSARERHKDNIRHAEMTAI